MTANQKAIARNIYETDIAVPTENMPVYTSAKNPALSALNDIIDGLFKWRIWLMLAYQDIKLRYRRSVLGPFWLTISMAVTVYSMGYLYSHLFQIPLNNYYPFLVSGMLSWSLISTIITEFSEGFAASDNLIKQLKLPYSLYIHRTVCRNIIIFFHNLIVIVPILVIYHDTIKVNIYSTLLIPGLLILYYNAISYGLILSMLGARYRDISQVIKSLVQVVFFITPIMWKPETLGIENHLLIDLNPIEGFVECIRQPLLGNAPTTINLVSILIVTAIGTIICARMFSKYRARIVYWL